MADFALAIGCLIFAFCTLLVLHLWIDGDLPRWMGGPK